MGKVGKVGTHNAHFDGRPYRHVLWIEFRNEMIDLCEGRCETCGRGETEVVLQVHHKFYVHGRKPWEYDPQDCEVICKGCHAAEHGKIPPKDGWVLVDVEDLEELGANCELCGTELRYVFFIAHDRWGQMEVGTVCCDMLTGLDMARQIRKREERKKRFVNSPRWKWEYDGWTIKQMTMSFTIVEEASLFFIRFAGQTGRKRFATLSDAKSHIFQIVDSGDAQRFRERNTK